MARSETGVGTGRCVADEVDRDPRWVAVRARADGPFFYAVKTTGVYCRPTCSARRPRPENVAFYATAAAAEAAGYRPCRRCRPGQPPVVERRAAQVAVLCRFIEDSVTPPSLATLAAHAGLSPWYVQRLFKAVTGLTPRAYAAALRSQRLRAALGTAPTVTEAIYAAGYNASARFYEQSHEVLGMTPRTYRSGGARLQIRFAIGECSLGAVLVAATDRGACAILLGDDPEALAHELQRRFPAADLVGADQGFEQLVAQVVGLIERPWDKSAALPLDIRGTAFQQRVWQALAKIPLGRTSTYSDIAAAIGAPQSARAVARACAANPLAVAIPCHRVVRRDGDVSGYRWGVERKRTLLSREAAGGQDPL